MTTTVTFRCRPTTSTRTTRHGSRAFCSRPSESRIGDAQMTALTVHSLDGSGDVVVDADVDSLKLINKLADQGGSLFKAQITVTAGDGPAEEIECMIDEAAKTVMVAPDVLARLQGVPPAEEEDIDLDDPFAAAVASSFAAPTADATSEVLGAAEGAPQAATAGGAAATEETSPDASAAAAAAELTPAAGDAAQQEYYEQFEAWILSQQPIAVYHGTDTTRVLHGLAWRGAANRQPMDRALWSLEAMLTDGDTAA